VEGKERPKKVAQTGQFAPLRRSDIYQSGANWTVCATGAETIVSFHYVLIRGFGNKDVAHSKQGQPPDASQYVGGESSAECHAAEATHYALTAHNKINLGNAPSTSEAVKPVTALPKATWTFIIHKLNEAGKSFDQTAAPHIPEIKHLACADAQYRLGAVLSHRVIRRIAGEADENAADVNWAIASLVLLQGGGYTAPGKRRRRRRTKEAQSRT
jgi:hypothetical protein